MPLSVPKSKHSRRLSALGLFGFLGLLFAYYMGDQDTRVDTSASFTIDTRDDDSIVRSLTLKTSSDSATFTIDTRDSDSAVRTLSLRTSNESAFFPIDTREPDTVVYALSVVAAKWSGFFMIDTMADDSSRSESAVFTIDTRDSDSVTRALSLASAKESDFFTIDTLAPPPEDTESDGLHDLWERIHFGDLFSQNRTDDYDGDGLSNFEEFAFGTDPTRFNDSAPVQFTLTPIGLGVRLTIRHNKHILAVRMVDYVYETSPTLAIWTDTTANWRETVAPLNLNGYVEWVTMSYDLPSAPARLFVRVRATPKP